jgi:hypothetical protein
MLLPFLWFFLRITYNPETTSQYILRSATAAISYVLWLIIAVMAVRFVASLNLVYDNKHSSLGFED